jgi:hypothetical protein
VGGFIAKQDIPWGGVNAYTRGQHVDADAVETNGWQDYVVGENTKEAREIKAEITGRDPADFETKTTGGRTSAVSSTTEPKG